MSYTSSSSISAASRPHTDRTSFHSVQRAARFRYAASCLVTDAFGLKSVKHDVEAISQVGEDMIMVVRVPVACVESRG
jgi:hypothetical protein